VMFSGMPSMRNADALGTVKAFLDVLAGLPVFAVEGACDAVNNGKATWVDDKGVTRKVDPSFPPTAAIIHDMADRFCDRQRTAAWNAAKILRVKKEIPANDIGMQEKLSGVIRGAVSKPPLDLAKHGPNFGIRGEEDTEAAQRRKAVKLEHIGQANDILLRKEFAKAGMAMPSDGSIPISPSLRKLLEE